MNSQIKSKNLSIVIEGMPGAGKTSTLMCLKKIFRTCVIIPERVLSSNTFKNRQNWVYANDFAKSKAIEDNHGVQFLDRYYMSTNIINDLLGAKSVTSFKLIKPSLWILLQCKQIDTLYQRIEMRSQELSGPWNNRSLFEDAFHKYQNYTKTTSYDSVPLITIDTTRSSCIDNLDIIISSIRLLSEDCIDTKKMNHEH
ncbi:AAA family ATPase [Photorhabdus laumondii]